MMIAAGKHSFINSLDPRVRLIAATLLAFFIAFSVHFMTLFISLAGAGILVALARLSLKQTVKRLVELNFFMLFLFLFLPFSVKGTPLFSLAGFAYSREGLEKSFLIALKANTIMISLTGLVGTMEPATLGQSMRFLGLPAKFIHIFLFMIRYLDVIGDEYKRLKTAMKLRGFKAKCNAYTLRSYGNLIGMVLVRSIERSERIMDAMRCRGFSGKFYSHAVFQIGKLDVCFSLLLLPFILTLAWLEFF